MFNLNLFVFLAIVSGTCLGFPQGEQDIETTTTTTPALDDDTLNMDNTNTLLVSDFGLRELPNTISMAPMYHELPFVKIGEKEYLIDSEQEVNFFRAAHICLTYDAQLVSIETSTEMEALSNHLLLKGLNSKSFWTSGNDLANEGSFFWLGTGYAMGYAKWSSGEPNNTGGNERCVNIWTYRNGNVFHFNDLKCSKRQYFICEKN